MKCINWGEVTEKRRASSEVKAKYTEVHILTILESNKNQTVSFDESNNIIHFILNLKI